MAVLCPVCQALSTDFDFCEHCQADLRALLTPRPPAECPLPGGVFVLSEDQRDQLGTPENNILVTNQERWLRLHWIDRRAEPEWHAAWKHRQGLALGVLPKVEAIEVDEGTWVTATTTGQAFSPWSASRHGSPLEDLQQLIGFVSDLAEVLEELHSHGLVWLNFDPTELERDPRGRVRISNLDVRAFPIGDAPHVLAVHQAYAAPEVVYLRTADLGPRTDVFHLSAMCYYWLARYLPQGLPGDGLEAVDFHLPPLRVYSPMLPEGIAAVLSRGMAAEAAHRFATPAAMVREFKDALERAQVRRAYRGAVAWDIGSRSIAGRTKTALKRGNEDQAFVRTFPDPDRALVGVADGITTCDVGNGALASFITTVVLENHFGGEMHIKDFHLRIAETCRKCSETLLEWAIEKGHRERLLAGEDLMGTTLVAGWLEGTSLAISNLGDSRAYLIVGGRIEQLTVDGDLASDLLAQGTPPERVREIGSMGKALRQCIGGCELHPDGQLGILEDSSTPSLSRWTLVPGDILVLCTDGLVEEGAFLEPEILVEIVRNHPQATAQELADLFVDAADSLQRVPSFLEPEGFGDNVSCVVVKVSER